jgi:hypothetical protein
MHAILPPMLFTAAALFAVVVLAASARRFGAAFAGLRRAQGSAPILEQCTVTVRTIDVTWIGGTVRRGQAMQTVPRQRAAAVRPLRAAA